MTYGLDRRLPDENTARQPVKTPAIGHGHWRSLDSQSRFQMVERELRPANDFIDGFPLAL